MSGCASKAYVHHPQVPSSRYSFAWGGHPESTQDLEAKPGAQDARLKTQLRLGVPTWSDDNDVAPGQGGHVLTGTQFQANNLRL